MAIYTATFAAVAITAAQDVFEITAPSTGRVAIREIRLNQYTDFGDAQAEILPVTILRGYTVSGTGGTQAITPGNIHGHTGAPVAASVVDINNTTVANTGSPVTLLADAWNVAAGWWYYPPEEERIVLEFSQRLVVRIGAPADSLTCNGTLVFEEIGKVAP